MQLTNPLHNKPATESLLAGSRQWVISGFLFLALFAFEIFNFDTTKFALSDLLGPVNFVGIQWATVLAIAFCSIDAAGLGRVLSERNEEQALHNNIYLAGAWFLGATMNAIMTWWAVSITLLQNNFGNEILSREQLLLVVPVFVAVLVLLTRVLFIGALCASGSTLLKQHRVAKRPSAHQQATLRPIARSSRPRPMHETIPSQPMSAPHYAQHEILEADQFETVYEDPPPIIPPSRLRTTPSVRPRRN